MKKVISILFIILFMTACFSSGSDGGGNVIVNPPEDKDDITAPINISIISSPPQEKAETTVDIQYIATQEGYTASDFVYKYELREGGILTKQEEGISYTKVKFTNLIPNTLYSFQVWGINKKTGVISATSSIATFRTISDADKKRDLEINAINFSTTKMVIGEEIEISYTVTNKGNVSHEFLSNISFGTWNDSFERVGTEEIWEIEPTERKTYSVKYLLKKAKVNANNTVELVYITPTILDLNSNEIVTFTQLLTKEINVILDQNAKIELKEIYVTNSTVFPGQSNISVRYDIKNPNVDDYLTIKTITPKFYTELGKDVSTEWIDSKSEEKRIPPGSQLVITRTYTLSTNATKGKILLDARVTGEIGGVQVIDENSEKIGVIEVRDPSSAKLEAWIAYPEGAKNGVVSAGQNFTIYYRVNFDGDVTLYDKGEIMIDYADIDGATIIRGNRTESIDFNQRKEWEIKMPPIEIVGNIKIKISKMPTYRIGEDEFEVKFDNTVVNIPIQVKKKPQLELEVGYEELNYGGLDGVIKSGSEFEVYATIINKNPDNKITGNTKVVINLDSIEGLRLANGEVYEKTVTIDEKVKWKLVAPSSKKIGSIKFNVKEYPIEPNSGEQYEITDKDLKADFRLGGDLTLKRIYCDWTYVEPGQSGIPIKFEIRNNGDVDVRVTDVKAVFSQNGKDVSNKWTLVETTIRENTVLTDLSSEVTVIAYYKLKENIFDGTDIIGNITVSGYAKGVELTSGNILEDKEPTYDMVINVKDIVAPTAVIKVSKETAKVGEAIFFDATSSFDNDQIAYYAWDFNARDGILQSVRESKVYYSYSEPGEYEVALQVNDREGNGPVTATIKILIVEDDSTKPEEEDPIKVVAVISYQNAPENGTMLVGFDGSGSTPNNLTYIWTFRDVYGNYLASRPGQSVSLLFPISLGFNKGDTIGTAILTVMDSNGKTAASDTIFVKIP